MKAVKTVENKNKLKSNYNYNLKTHVILICCDPLLLFSMVMDKYIYIYMYIKGMGEGKLITHFIHQHILLLQHNED